MLLLLRFRAASMHGPGSASHLQGGGVEGNSTLRQTAEVRLRGTTCHEDSRRQLGSIDMNLLVCMHVMPAVCRLGRPGRVASRRTTPSSFVDGEQPEEVGCKSGTDPERKL